MLFHLQFEDLLVVIPIILFSLTFHEYAHAYTAVKLGDPTPKIMGRLTLNPIPHIDIIGFFLLIVAGFGWAKPVMVNPLNFKNPIRDNAIVAGAGPLSNLILGFISSLLFHILKFGETVLMASAYINFVLFIINMIPIAPLDGSRIYYAVAKFTPREIEKYEIQSTFIILGIFASSLILKLIIGYSIVDKVLEFILYPARFLVEKLF